MTVINRATLFGKLNPLLFKAVESAVVFGKLRHHPKVELVHWVNQILNLQDSDWHRVIRHFGLDEAKLANDLSAVLERLPRTSDSIDLSADLENAVERAWVYASLACNAANIRGVHLLVGMLHTGFLCDALFKISSEFRRIDLTRLAADNASIVSGSPEDQLATSFQTAAPGEASEAIAPAAMGKQEALKRYAVDLTARARAGELDAVTGRDDEIRQIVDILMRRRQNNPLLTGEAGVGKTAVVEGFALRIAKGDVPPPLREVSLMVLDIGLLQAGASMKGEFENRLRQVIEEVQSSEKPIILFIDEAHTLIGAGGAAGTGDAANLLKPALARGTLRTIAATTWSEYKRHIEKDPALTRRFQVVQVHEPDEAKALKMMRGLTDQLERHHGVQILDSALEASVRLSHRYIPARQLPDKSVSLLDTACARVAVSQYATPGHIEDEQKAIEALETELAIVCREAAIGLGTPGRREVIEAELAERRAELATLEARWTAERELTHSILEARRELAKLVAELEQDDAEAAELAASAEEGSVDGAAFIAEAQPASDAATREEKLAHLQALQAKLAELQADKPLVLSTVDEMAVAAVVADWTGIPVGRMVKDEIEAVLKLADRLNERVLGQNHALEAIARRVQTSRARLDDPNKPIGVFMLVGPSGVGKTETALTLAEMLYGGEQNLISINMSEFQEAHTVSTLKGAPPGYVGYGEGGVLTEAVRRRPYSVVLLDEIEKAHSDVHEIFFQVFDKGWMEDGEGRYIDFRNTVILLTSNVGSDLVMSLCKDPELMPEPEGIAKALRAPLREVFPAALLGRLNVVPYYPLSDAILADIIRLQLDRIAKRVSANHKVDMRYDSSLIGLIAARCNEIESGGRMIDAILTSTVLPRLSTEILSRLSKAQSLQSIVLSAAEGEIVYEFS
ncbi:type VI secretion system ATPase TssH [Parachitinimonas caeni]|uniref:Type VI secretion system ATPase TssH n=1 Tax=Parachitinimonas caeni TaxID=3031301 RepID=A0ABT7E2L1_9NEIS|nr:type VI secretion system ATPase TssH [Parachitinimonas caeni]MDK2126561.1 type VI secretion system ATPase TssH [Parachitinimonas caeni]